MEKKTILTIILSLILLVSTIFLASSVIQPSYELDNYTYTKAICTDTNFCQDYEISCKNSQLISRIPIQGASVQFSESWEDPRSQETIDRMCE